MESRESLEEGKGKGKGKKGKAPPPPAPPKAKVASDGEVAAKDQSATKGRGKGEVIGGPATGMEGKVLMVSGEGINTRYKVELSDGTDNRTVTWVKGVVHRRGVGGNAQGTQTKKT